MWIEWKKQGRHGRKVQIGGKKRVTVRWSVGGGEGREGVVEFAAFVRVGVRVGGWARMGGEKGHDQGREMREERKRRKCSGRRRLRK